MSDFLNQFDSNNYKKSDEIKKEEKDVATEVKKGRIIGPEHETEIDTEYNKKKRKKYIIIGIVALIFCIFIFFLVRNFNRVTVINFVGKDVNDAKVWALKYNIILDTEYVYNTQYSEDEVISQNIKSKEVIYKKDVLSIKVSKGADANEKITLPDFTTMTYSQIREWIDENKLSNTYILQEYSTTIEKTKFIRMIFGEDGVDQTNFKRKNSLTIYVSKGVEQAQKDVTVIDFSNKAKGEVDTWANTNNIKINYTEAASNTIADGFVISQSISAGTLIAKGDTITIKVSIGSASVVPDYSLINKEEAPTYGGDITATVKTMYSDTVAYGKLISQSVSKGTKLYKNNKYVDLIYSEGRPFIDNLVGKSEKDLPAYFYAFNIKGANITYTTVYVDSAETKGNIVSTSKVNEYINLETNITINVSKGNL